MNTPTLLLLVLASTFTVGCVNQFNINAKFAASSDDTAGDDSADTDSIDTAETGLVDTVNDSGMTDTAEVVCGFTVITGVDTDGDGFNEYADVQTKPVFTQLSPTDLTINAGDIVTMDFAVTSYGGCGDINFHRFTFTLEDQSGQVNGWVEALSEASVPSDFEDTDNGTVFPSFIADWRDSADNGLFYNWQDAEGIDLCGYTGHPEACGAMIETQSLEASQTRNYRFTWAGSNYLPTGRTVKIMLESTQWTDVSSGNEVYNENESWYTGRDSDGNNTYGYSAAVNVTIAP